MMSTVGLLMSNYALKLTGIAGLVYMYDMGRIELIPWRYSHGYHPR